MQFLARYKFITLPPFLPLSTEKQKERCMDKLAMANGVEHITTMHRKARDGK